MIAIFVFCLLIWLGIAVWSKAYLLCAIAIAVICLVGRLAPKNQTTEKTLLLPAKVILAISFWGCVALCLVSYQQSVACLDCTKSYLARLTEPFLTSAWQVKNLKALWQFAPRFITLSGLFVLWVVAFKLTQRRKQK